jgi:hypothetical protein
MADIRHERVESYYLKGVIKSPDGNYLKLERHLGPVVASVLFPSNGYVPAGDAKQLPSVSVHFRDGLTSVPYKIVIHGGIEKVLARE